VLGSTKNVKEGLSLYMMSRNALEHLPTMLHAESALKSLTTDQLEKAGLPSPCSISNFVSKAKRSKDPKHQKLQSKLQRVQTEVKWSEMFQNGTKAQQALLNARLNLFASSALKPAPALLTAPYRLTDFQTQFLVAPATSQLPGKMPAICACDSALDVTHMLCCKQGESGWLLRHNLLQSSLVGFARVQGLPVEQNVRKSFDDAQQKSKKLEPDAIITSQNELSGSTSRSPNRHPRPHSEAGSKL